MFPYWILIWYAILILGIYWFYTLYKKDLGGR
jgi:hypothetical protein